MDLPAPRKLTLASYRYLAGYLLGATTPSVLMLLAGLAIPAGASLVAAMTIAAFYLRYWRGHKLATRHLGSAPVEIVEAPDLHLEVLALVEKSGQRLPEIWSYRGAGASGVSYPGGRIIVLGQALVAPFWRLNETANDFWRARLRAAVAHELGHLRYNDALIGCAFACAVVALESLLLASLLAAGAWPVAVAIAISGGVVLGLAQIKLQRLMEDRADDYALALTDEPQALADLLIEMEEGASRAERYRGWALPNLGHPPLRHRLARIARDRN